MRKIKVLVVGEREITVSELMPGQIDQLMSMKADDQVAPSLGTLLASDLNADAVVLSTGIKGADLLNDFTLEELADIWKAVAEVNDFLLLRLGTALKTALALVDQTKSAGLSA